MNNIFVRLCIIILINLSLHASIADDIRKADAEAYAIKLNNVVKNIENYMLATADENPTFYKIKSYYEELTDDDFKNYNKNGDLQIESLTSKYIIIENITSSSNKYLKSDLKNAFETLTSIVFIESNDAIKYYFKSSVKHVLETKDEVDKDPNKLWFTKKEDLPKPGDESKLYYVLNEDGTIDIFRWDSDKNDYIQVSSSEQGMTGDGNCLHSIGSYDVLKNIIGQEPQCARILENGIMATYWWSDEKKEWVIEGSASSKNKLDGETANNIGDLLDRNETNKWFNAEVGSNVDINGLLGTSVNMKRMLNYWKTSSLAQFTIYTGSSEYRNIYVAENLKDLPSSEVDGAVAYLKINNNNYGFMGDNTQYEVIYQNGQWLPVVDNFKNLLFAANKNIKNKYYLLSYRKEFIAYDTYWKENTSINPIFVTKDDRTGLPYGSSSGIYLTYNLGNEPHNGGTKSLTYKYDKNNYLWEWRYFIGTDSYRNLIDAITRTSLIEVYNNKDVAALVGNILYIKDKDNRNRLIYKKVDNNTFWTKNSQQIPNFLIENKIPNLPPFKDAENINFNNDAVIVDNYSQITAWTDAPKLSKVYYKNEYYYLKKGSGLNYWTNNNSSNIYSYGDKIFSYYSRLNVPLINNANTKVYTRKLCTNDTGSYTCPKNNGSENRYTDDGITASIDPTYKEWFYSLSGSNLVNNLLDGVLAKDYYSDNDASTYIVNPNNGMRFIDNKYWKEFEYYNNRTFSNPYNLSIYCSNGTYKMIGTEGIITKTNYKGLNITWNDGDGDTAYNSGTLTDGCTRTGTFTWKCESCIKTSYRWE